MMSRCAKKERWTTDVDEDDEEELERRRQASRLSSKRSRERQRHQLEYFLKTDVELRAVNARLATENRNLRDAIRQVRMQVGGLDEGMTSTGRERVKEKEDRLQEHIRGPVSEMPQADAEEDHLRPKVQPTRPHDTQSQSQRTLNSQETNSPFPSGTTIDERSDRTLLVPAQNHVLAEQDPSQQPCITVNAFVYSILLAMDATRKQVQTGNNSISAQLTQVLLAELLEKVVKALQQQPQQLPRQQQYLHVPQSQLDSQKTLISPVSSQGSCSQDSSQQSQSSGDTDSPMHLYEPSNEGTETSPNISDQSEGTTSEFVEA